MQGQLSHELSHSLMLLLEIRFLSVRKRDSGVSQCLCVTHPTWNEIHVSYFSFVFLYCEISLIFWSRFQNPISNAAASDGTVRFVAF